MKNIEILGKLLSRKANLEIRPCKKNFDFMFQVESYTLNKNRYLAFATTTDDLKQFKAEIERALNEKKDS